VVLLLEGCGAISYWHWFWAADWIWMAGVGGILIGCVLAAPVLFPPLSRLLGLGLGRAFPASLARRTIARYPRRAANLASHFVVCLGLVTALLTLVVTSEINWGRDVTQDFAIDYAIHSETNVALPDNVLSQLRTVTGGQIAPLGQAPMHPIDPDLARAKVTFGPEPLFTTFAPETVVEGSGVSFLTGLALNRGYAQAHGLALGDEVRFMVAGNTPYERQATVSVDLIIDSTVFGDFVISAAWLSQQLPGYQRSQLMPTTTVLVSCVGTCRESLREDLEKIVASVPDLKVQTKAEYGVAISPGVPQGWLLIYLLGGFSLVILLAASAQRSRYAVVDRADDLATLRALGASAHQVKQLIRFEGLLPALAGSLVGIGLGVGLAMTQLIRDGRTALSLTIPWPWILAMLVGVFILIFLGVNQSARKAVSV
jgi:putative ABC transport system permease protein